MLRGSIRRVEYVCTLIPPVNPIIRAVVRAEQSRGMAFT